MSRNEIKYLHEAEIDVFRASKATFELNADADFVVKDKVGTALISVDTSTSTVNFRGNINVTGSSVFTSSSISTITDPLIELADGNVANTVDIGIWGTYTLAGPTTRYTAVFRDVNGRWNFTNGMTVAPSSNVTYNYATQLADIRCSDVGVGTATSGGMSLLTTATTVAAYAANLNSITATIITNSLGNLGSTAISLATWVYMSTLDQYIATTSDVTHRKLVVTGSVTDGTNGSSQTGISVTSSWEPITSVTYTNTYGVYSATTGSLASGGIITNAYGGFFALPTVGANRVALYTESFSVGYSGVGFASGNAGISGKLGINTTNGAVSSTARAEITDTTLSQLRLSYSGSFYSEFAVGSSGTMTVTTVGATLLSTNATGSFYPLQLANSAAAGYTQVGFIGTSRTYSCGVGNGSEVTYGVANSFFIFDNNAAAIRTVITSTGNMGVNTTTPDRRLDVLDASNPQLRLTQADASKYVDFYSDSNGYINIFPSGGGVTAAAIVRPFTVATNGSATDGFSMALFDSGSAPTAGNLYGIGINKSGVDRIMLGINKNTTTGNIPASACYISTYGSGSAMSLGRGGSNNLPNSADIYISTSGTIGIGTTSPTGQLNVLSTTEQLRLAYNASNYASFTTSSGGDLTIAPSGGDLAITAKTVITDSTASFVLTAGDGTVNFATYVSGAATTPVQMGSRTNHQLGIFTNSGTPFVVFTTDSRVGIGTQSPTATAKLTVASTSGYGILSSGTKTSFVTAGYQYAISDQSSFAPSGTSPYAIASSFLAQPFHQIALADTLTTGSGMYIDMQPGGNLGTITTLAGLFISPGVVNTGTVTTGYGLYCRTPLYGTTKVCAYFEGKVGFGTTAPSQAIEVGGTDGQIYINSANSNMLYFNGNGVAIPSIATSRSLGTKIVLYPQFATGQADFALGISSSTLWNSIPLSSNRFQWYAGATAIATLTGAGRLGIGVASPAYTIDATSSGSIGGGSINTNILNVYGGIVDGANTIIANASYNAGTSQPQDLFINFRRGGGGAGGDTGVCLSSFSASHFFLYNHGDFRIRYTTQNTDSPSVNDASAVDMLTLTATGNLGIGTTGPDRKLEALDTANPQLRLTYTDNSVYTDFQTDSSGYLKVTLTGNNTYITRASGNTNFYVQNTATGSANLYLDSSIFASINSTTQFAINIGATEVARIQSTAFGIFTTTPRRHLDVLDASSPQMRLTYTDNSVYTDFQTTSSGVMTVTPTGNAFTISNSTNQITLTLADGTISKVSGSNFAFGSGINPNTDSARDIGTTALRWNRLYVTQSIGLGITTTPSYNLQINGTALFGDVSSGATNISLGASAPTGTRNLWMQYIAGPTIGSTAGDYSLIQSVYWGTNYSQLALNPVAREVGICTRFPQNMLSVSPNQYSTGTAAQSGTTITGTGTTFTAAMVGSQFVFSTGVSAGTITGYTSATSITVSVSQTVSSGAGIAYYINYTGLQVNSVGNVVIGATSCTFPFEVVGAPATVTDNNLIAMFRTTTAGAVPAIGFQYVNDGVGAKIAMQRGGAGTTLYFLTSNSLGSGITTTNCVMKYDGTSGFGTGASPARRVEVLDGSGSPQFRLTYTASSVYSDFQSDSSGNLYIIPTGNTVFLSQTTSSNILDMGGSSTSNCYINQHASSTGTYTWNCYQGSGTGTLKHYISFNSLSNVCDVAVNNLLSFRITPTATNAIQAVSATNVTPQSSPTLGVWGQSWSSTAGTVYTQGYMQMINITNNISVTLDRLAFFTSPAQAGPTPTEKFCVTTAGNFGINTTNPAKKLEIVDSSAAQVRLSYTAGSVYTDIQVTSSNVLTVSGLGGTGTGTTSGIIATFNNNTSPADNTVNAIVNFSAGRAVVGYMAISPIIGQSGTIITTAVASAKWVEISSNDRGVVLGSSNLCRIFIDTTGYIGIGAFTTVSAPTNVLHITQSQVGSTNTLVAQSAFYNAATIAPSGSGNIDFAAGHYSKPTFTKGTIVTWLCGANTYLDTFSLTAESNYAVYAKAPTSGARTNVAIYAENETIGAPAISSSATVSDKWSEYYNTGTASQSTTTITGSGTGFTSAMVGMFFMFANGRTGGYILSVASATSLTVSISQTVASGSYVIYKPAMHIIGNIGSVNNGNVGVGVVSPLNLFSVSPTNTSFTFPGTVSQSASTVTGSGTSFSSSMIGQLLTYTNGTSGGIITAVASTTSITVSTSQTVSSTNYVISYPGFQVDSTGQSNIYGYATKSETITTSTALSTYLDSLINPATGPLSCTLAAGISDQTKFVRLLHRASATVSISCVASGGGTFNLTPAESYRRLRYNGTLSCWQIEEGSGSLMHDSFYPTTQQGTKLIGTGATGSANQGWAIALSSDGNTLVLGANEDNSSIGAIWVFTRTGTTWTQQGTKLTGTGATGATPRFGVAVAISGDGNTFAMASSSDNSSVGAVWVFTRSGNTWTQQGTKIVGTGATGTANQGWAISFSRDGNTMAVGGKSDNTNVGAVWIFTRSGGVWTQQGLKLVGTGNVGASQQGISVALSATGNILAIGGSADNSSVGAIWVFTRSNSAWTQQGLKLTGSNAVGSAFIGDSVAISADGNTIATGGDGDNTNVGAVWVFTRSSDTWTQQGAKLIGLSLTGSGLFGATVALTADGNTLAIGAPKDNSVTGNGGAIWTFVRSGNAWAQQGAKFTGTGATFTSVAVRQASALAISSNGNTLVSSSYQDNNQTGAVWVFI